MASTETAISPDLSGAIGRSRSRYKGPRFNKPVTSTQDLPTHSAIPSQKLQDAAPKSQLQTSNGHAAPPRSVVDSTSKSLKDSVKQDAHPCVRHDSGVGDLGSTKIAAENPHAQNTGQLKTLKQQPQYLSESSLQERRPSTPSRGFGEDSLDDRPSVLPRKTFRERFAGQSCETELSESREKLKRTISAPIAMEAPQSTSAPAFDAPISASNAGERRVTVRYGEFETSLPVTPSTTPTDIIRVVNDQIPDSINAEKTIVEESYRQLGLVRPLRKYESVRNVMNSWDNDTHNKLMVTEYVNGDSHEALELDRVSRTQPGDTSVSMYHSQKPGHWDKRWITLRSDGQIVVAKKNGGESSNICHLSDFDIYGPTARQLSKRIRPPRKMCFAVKSQQKSSMFMTTVNFVHFFSTGDKALASAWYKAVQEWRSWYLVSVMGEGPKKTDNIRKFAATFEHQSSNVNKARGKGCSVLSIGSKDHDLPKRDDFLQGMALRNRGTPVASSPRNPKEKSAARSPTIRKLGPPKVKNPEQPEIFAATSLLGRTYTQRQKAQQSPGNSRVQESSPSPAVPTVPSLSDSPTGSPSRQPKPRPLVDLTPQYREPPQHTKKGRGIVPEQIPAGGLVEIATSPEEAIPLPPTTTWQRPGTSSNQDGPSLQRSRTIQRDRSTATTGRQQKSQSPEKWKPSLAGSLLAGSSNGQDTLGMGRGVMTGDREAKAPMMDMREGSKFVPGSLLEHAERRPSAWQ